MKNRIKELRIKAGLTQKQLAVEIGTSDANLSRYERNLVEPNADIRKKLADYFSVSVPYLQGFININIPNNLKFDSKKDAIDCIEKIIKALNISKEDLEKSINNEKQD